MVNLSETNLLLKDRFKIFAVGVLILCVYVAGIVFPEPLWGAHYLHFLPNWGTALFLTIGIVGVYYPIFSKGSGIELDTSNKHDILWGRLKYIIPLLAGAFANALPIAEDAYGDAYFIKPDLFILLDTWTWEMTVQSFGYNPFKPSIGVDFFFGLMGFFGYVLGVEPPQIVKPFEVVLFIVFQALWLNLVSRSVGNFEVRLALAVVGFLAPFTLIFHEHYEAYALSFTALIGFILILKRFFENPVQKRLVTLAISFLLLLKFHILFWLALPAVLIAAFHLWTVKNQRHASLLNLRNVLFFLVFPGLLVIVATYFLKGSFNGARYADINDLYTAFFVPIIPKEPAPYDRYSLFNWAHISDYFQLFFSWSPVSLFVLISIGMTTTYFNRLGAYALALLVSFFALSLSLFVINPLLGMTCDWDLFSFPALFLLAFMVEAISKSGKEFSSRLIVVPTLSIALLNLPIFVVNGVPSLISQRYESLGYHEYKHFWIGSSTLFETAIVLELDEEEKIRRLSGAVIELEPLAVKGGDNEYSEMLRQLGNIEEQGGNVQIGLDYYLRALEYNPLSVKTHLNLSNIYLKLGEPRKALSFVPLLVELDYPSRYRALKAAIHASTAAQEYGLAVEYCDKFLQTFPDDTRVSELRSILTGESPSSALQYFQPIN